MAFGGGGGVIRRKLAAVLNEARRLPQAEGGARSTDGDERTKESSGDAEAPFR